MKLNRLFENKTLMDDPREAYFYAKKLGRRVPELEPIIMKDPTWAYYYANDVIKGRWPEAEPYIMKDPNGAEWYLGAFPDARNPSKDVYLVLNGYAITDVPNTITDEQTEKLIKLIEPNVIKSYDITAYRVYYEPTIRDQLKNNKLKLVTTNQLLNNETLRQQFLKAIGYIKKTDFE